MLLVQMKIRKHRWKLKQAAVECSRCCQADVALVGDNRRSESFGCGIA